MARCAGPTRGARGSPPGGAVTAAGEKRGSRVPTDRAAQALHVRGPQTRRRAAGHDVAEVRALGGGGAGLPGAARAPGVPGVEPAPSPGREGAVGAPCGDTAGAAAGWGALRAPGKRNLSRSRGRSPLATRGPSAGRPRPSVPPRLRAPDPPDEPAPHCARAPHAPGRRGWKPGLPQRPGRALLWGPACGGGGRRGGAGLQVQPRKSRAPAAGFPVCWGDAFPGPPPSLPGAGGGRAGAAGLAGPAGSSHSSPSRSTQPRTRRDGAGRRWQLVGVGRQWGELKTPHISSLPRGSGSWRRAWAKGQPCPLDFFFF